MNEDEVNDMLWEKEAAAGLREDEAYKRGEEYMARIILKIIYEMGHAPYEGSSDEAPGYYDALQMVEEKIRDLKP